LVRKGHLEEAAECYGRIAQGSSLESEVAMYEKARLESRALGRGAAALATLDEHAKRFPRGVLSTEAGLTRIELLTRLGRTNDALKAIELALAGPIGNERGGDLFALRGQILSNRGDCTGANAAFALARSHGVPPSRPLGGEKRCAEHPATNDSTTNTTE
jgi:tetratricopeptide (TPR) repeat protein